MANLFEGLENLGLSGAGNMKLYEQEKETKAATAAKEAVKEASEEDYIFDKSFKCPVCDKTFTAKATKTGKAKSIGFDPDLRPHYQGIDTLKYDAISCEKCGYSAVARYFAVNPTSGQIKLIREGLKSFSGLPKTEGIYTYDDAITRHKLALACCVMKHAKASEKAYTCLKIAWLLRGKAEEGAAAGVPEAEIKALKEQELEYISGAYDGFNEAFSHENFPMCGMDENTVTFLCANLAHEVHKDDDAMRLLARIITARDVNSRIKDKANELKEQIKAGK